MKVYVPFMAYHDKVGATLASILRVYDGTKLVAVQQQNARLAVDQSVTFSINFKPVHGKRYTLVANVNDIHAQHDKRTVILQTT